MEDSNSRLRTARAAAGFRSARAAAIRHGWTESTYASHENGQTPVPLKAAESYAKAFKTSAAWILTGEGAAPIKSVEPIAGIASIAPTAPASNLIRPAGPEPSEVEKVGEGWPDTGEEWMDVRGVTVGGDDSFFYFGDVIDQVRRPPGIRNAKNVAALNVAGESMVPRFAPGELIYVQHRAPAPGDDVVVELYPENDGDPPKSFLKRLIRKTGPRLYCRQFNPASDLEFDNGEVKILWRVLTLRDLLG